MRAFPLFPQGTGFLQAFEEIRELFERQVATLSVSIRRKRQRADQREFIKRGLVPSPLFNGGDPVGVTDPWSTGYK